MSPFDVINHLCTSKKSDWESVGDKDYNSFMVNRGLSYFADTIFHANEMNRRFDLPKDLQYEYLVNAIDPKKKRFSKWASSKKDKDIQMVSEWFKVSLLKAQAIHKLLSESDIKDIEEKMFTGGSK